MTSIYGPNDNFSDHFSHVVPALIKKIINEKVLKVWGNKLVTRDFVYVGRSFSSYRKNSS